MTDISEWVKDNFGFLEVKVTPLRAYTNDVYEVESAEKYLLKIYGDGWKTETEVVWEIELLDYLKKNNVDVAGTIKGRSGAELFTIDFEGNRRLAVLFEWAQGKKPVPPFSMDDYELLGEAIAKIHKASDGFQSSQKRQELGFNYLIDKPLSVIIDVCDDDKTQYFQNYAKKLKDYIHKLELLGLNWGFVHDDVTFDNIHITDDRKIIFYDFDSGGIGWRALDLQGWAVFDQSTAPRQTAFIKGYRTIRDISDIDVDASPYLHVANEFWGIGLDLDRRILKNGKKATNIYLEEKVEMLDKFMDYFEKKTKV